MLLFHLERLRSCVPLIIIRQRRASLRRAARNKTQKTKATEKWATPY
jgi:hypothetical protein